MILKICFLRNANVILLKFPTNGLFKFRKNVKENYYLIIYTRKYIFMENDNNNNYP